MTACLSPPWLLFKVGASPLVLLSMPKEEPKGLMKILMLLTAPRATGPALPHLYHIGGCIRHGLLQHKHQQSWQRHHHRTLRSRSVHCM